MFGGDVGNDEILPDGEPKFAGAEAVGNVGERAHLRDGQPANRDGDADVVEAGLRLRMNADVAGAIDGAARFALGAATRMSGKARSFSVSSRKRLDAPAVDEVFEARFFAVGAIAVLGEDADHGGGNGDGLFGPQQEAAVAWQTGGGR